MRRKVAPKIKPALFSYLKCSNGNGYPWYLKIGYRTITVSEPKFEFASKSNNLVGSETETEKIFGYPVQIRQRRMLFPPKSSSFLCQNFSSSQISLPNDVHRSGRDGRN